MGIRLLDIKDRLPPVTHRITVRGEDGQPVTIDATLRRLTPDVRAVVYGIFPDPQPPIETEDSEGKPLERPFVNRDNPAYAAGLERMIQKRMCAVAAIALNVDVSDPKTNTVFGWDSLGPGDRNERRRAYCELAVAEVERSLLTSELSAIIDKASGIETKKDSKKDAEKGDADESQPADLVAELGKPSAPTPGGES
jgi:hypothetical protein